MAIPAAAAGASAGGTAGGTAAGGAAAGGTAGGTAGGAATGAGGGTGASDIAGMAIGSSSISIDLDQLITSGGTSILEGIIDSQRYTREQQLLDRQFQEDVRRYNLNYALQQYALRHRISMAEAQMRFQQEQAQRQWQHQLATERPMASLTMREREMALREAADKIENRRRFGKAFTRGLARGLSKGGAR